MKLNQLSPAPGSTRDGKRKGRGASAGQGKTAGRGTKGQKARSGGYHKVGFEGGQMPLQRRLPKRGFKNYPFRKIYAVVNVGDLEQRFEAGAEVNLEQLLEKGLVGRSKAVDGIKLLGGGKLSKALKITVDRASQAAQEQVTAAGGQVTLNQQPVSAEAAAE